MGNFVQNKIQINIVCIGFLSAIRTEVSFKSMVTVFAEVVVHVIVFLFLNLAILKALLSPLKKQLKLLHLH